MHDEELEEFTIFKESNEELGLLYDSYKGLHKTIEEFMNKVEVGVDLLVKDPFKTKIELNDDIKRFKSDISVKLVYSPIEVNNLKSIIGQIKKFKQSIDKSLTRYSKLRNKISFGGNYIRAILNRPKVYSKEVDPEKYELENHNIRTVNRAMDWCEKALLDLFNLVDQDLNILTIINRVYVKQHIYESTENTESPEECMEWIENFIYNEEIQDSEESISDDTSVYEEEGDILNTKIFTEDDNANDPENNQDDDKKEKESEEEEKNEEESKDGSNDDETLLDSETTGTDEQEDEVIDQTPPSDESDSKEDTSNEDNKEEDKVEEEDKEPESMPKKADKAENGKNGVRRKKLYIAFIEWCKEYNPKNTFGSIFDKDAFQVTYPFVPNEMRYFYRLANPMVCTLGGDLTFFQASELRKLNANNNQKDKYFIFAATLKDIRVFNREDKKVYFATQKDGVITLGDCLGDTFDLYLQIMIKKGDILNAPLNEFTLFNLEDYTNEREN